MHTGTAGVLGAQAGPACTKPTCRFIMMLQGRKGKGGWMSKYQPTRQSDLASVSSPREQAAGSTA